MRQSIAAVTKLASVPVGVVVGIGMFLMTEPWCTTSVDPRGGGNACMYLAGQALTQPRFSWWLCVLAGAAVAVGVFLFPRIVRTPLSAATRHPTGLNLSSGCLAKGRPGHRFGVGTAMFETAMEDADQPVSKSAKRLMMCVAAGAVGRVTGPGAC